MAISHLAKGHDIRAQRLPLGPPITLGAALAATAAVAGAAARTLPADLVLTLASVSLFVLAAAIAGLAWQQRSRRHPGLSYWDVAGALTLIGICASALVEPEQMARVMNGTSAF